jgi:N-acetylglucosaminyldiphosphoundecaprenol N-acetyl-beta-D-mannosaminyltransferase
MNASSRVWIGRIPVDRVTVEDTLRAVAGAVRNDQRITILNANANAVTIAERDPAFAAALQSADLVFCDGFGVYAAAKALRTPLSERFTWADFTDKLALRCRDEGIAMFLLGARDGVAAEAARRLRELAPGLTVFSHHGYFDKSDAGSAEIIGTVNRSGANVVLVGFGMPAQEHWIARHRKSLRAHVVFSVGAAIDYAAGQVARGPRFLTQYGFEWLARLLIEPRRLWRRYLIGLPDFALVVLRQRLSGRPRALQAPR